MIKHIAVLTLFPELFDAPRRVGVVGRAISDGLLNVDTLHMREHGLGRHLAMDDTPYGGGGGMILRPEPLVASIEQAKESMPDNSPVVFLSPQGEPFTQRIAEEMAEHDGLILLCGRYEGVDQRVRDHWIDREVSLGDYVLSGGELGALVMIDAIARLVPGVLGNPESLSEESFQRPYLEYPQYTRPAEFRDLGVPDVLRSGDHGKIRRWRIKQALLRTFERRPELLQGAELTREEQKILKEIERERSS
jgi:tRNA (guanine37-N1)-methyltransferase